MRLTKSHGAIAIAIGLVTSPAYAQSTTDLGKGPGGSPHVRTEWVVAGAKLSIEYGRPFLRGRSEASMMPVGQPWRTGADQATVLTTDKPLTFGTLRLPAGSYTLNTQPGTAQWELLVGTLKAPGQWGIPYAPQLERGRVPMNLGKTKSAVEQVTISIDPAPTGGTLRVEWGTVSASAPFTVGK